MKLIQLILLLLLISCASDGQIESYTIPNTIPNIKLRQQELNLSIKKDNTEASKADAVIALSNEIAKHLGEVKYHDRKYSYRKLQNYDIVTHHRLLPNHGWVYIYEIVEKGMNMVGYTNTRNPDWVEVGGTTTINLPPQEIAREVLLELEGGRP